MVARYYNKSNDPACFQPFRSGGFHRDATLPGCDGEAWPITRLPPFLRALLVTDGTVTKMLEAYFWEPLEVRTLEQEFVQATQAIAWISLQPGDRLLRRHARLIGRDSGRVYANALSAIRAERVPEAFRQRLIDREIGIGVLIRDSGLESYREVLDMGLEETETGEKTVFRTYRIIIERAPVILITESFPLAVYQSPMPTE